ncbi:unnamed protein product [Psylliodes chrysocephalus]|uniref:Uncharacterized protein n=1 Tax=Psylliodes chrysocephalus TaxID=3402493 RepID=A0A9P0CJ92_9CUCU|nr:unnamed protein product [Psylliodes chrysocephala]
MFLKESREELVSKALEYTATTCAKLVIDIESRNRKTSLKYVRRKPKDAGLIPQQEVKRAMLDCIVELEKRLTSMNNEYQQFAVVHSEKMQVMKTYIHQFTNTFDDLEEEEMLPEVKRLKRHLKASGIKIDDAAS